MGVVLESVERITALIEQLNDQTGKDDTNLSDAIESARQSAYDDGHNDGALENSTLVTDRLIDKTITKIETNVEIIGINAFFRCNALAEVYAPYAHTLSASCFRECAFERIDLPRTTSIGGQCFSGCSALKTVILRADTLCALGAMTVFSSTPIFSGTGYIYVPAALVEEYKAATNWSGYATQIRAIEDYPEVTGG